MRRFVAVVLVLAGGGFFVWQYVGTNATASDSQNEAREAITKSIALQGDPNKSAAYPWTAGAGAGTDVKIIVKQPVEPKKIKIGSKSVDAVGVLSIPKIGVKDAAVVDDFTDAALDEGLIGSMGSAPGQVGNFVVIGHVITHGEIFKNLKNLRKGNTVKVETTAGTFTYKIRGGPVTVMNTDTWPLRPVPSKRKSAVATKSVITLITCAARYHTDQRIAIFGDLVETS